MNYRICSSECFVPPRECQVQEAWHTGCTYIYRPPALVRVICGDIETCFMIQCLFAICVSRGRNEWPYLGKMLPILKVRWCSVLFSKYVSQFCCLLQQVQEWNLMVHRCEIMFWGDFAMVVCLKIYFSLVFLRQEIVNISENDVNLENKSNEHFFLIQATCVQVLLILCSYSSNSSTRPRLISHRRSVNYHLP